MNRVAVLTNEKLISIDRAYVFWQDANSGNITKIGKERARGD